MRDDCVNCGSTEENRRGLPLSGTEVDVLAAGKQRMFTMYMVAGGRPGTGENTTISFDVYAGAATRTDMKRNDRES